MPQEPEKAACTRWYSLSDLDQLDSRGRLAENVSLLLQTIRENFQAICPPHTLFGHCYRTSLQDQFYLLKKMVSSRKKIKKLLRGKTMLIEFPTDFFDEDDIIQTTALYRGMRDELLARDRDTSGQLYLW